MDLNKDGGDVIKEQLLKGYIVFMGLVRDWGNI